MHVFPDDDGLWESTHASLRAQRLKLQQLLADAEGGVAAVCGALAAASEGAAMAPLGWGRLRCSAKGICRDQQVAACPFGPSRTSLRWTKGGLKPLNSFACDQGGV